MASCNKCIELASADHVPDSIEDQILEHQGRAELMSALCQEGRAADGSNACFAKQVLLIFC